MNIADERFAMQCPLCGSQTADEVSNLDAKTFEPLRVCLCTQCGLIQQDPIPSAAELREYYAREYRQDYKHTITPKPKHVYRAGKAALDRLRFLNRAGVAAGRLLDIGAGGGEFTYLAGKAGFTAEGVEPNEGYSEYARLQYRSQVRTAELDEIRGRYDVVTLFHVLEHLPNPLETFARIHSLIEPGGKLFVEVPWIEAADISPLNTYFKAHLFYFSIDTLSACASKYFTPVEVDTGFNLRMLFEARPEPAARQLPTAESVQRLRLRMRRKGWVDYLIYGRGALKFLHKYRRLREEAAARGKAAKQILDEIWANHHGDRGQATAAA